MKIVFASNTSLAGVCELMAREMSELSEDIEARVLNNGAKRHSWYLREPRRFDVFSIRNKEHVNACLEWADVVHCMANTSARAMRRPDLIGKKIWVFQWHGAQLGPLPWEKKDYKYVKWIHIGQGWQKDRYFSPFFKECGCRVLPNIITVDDALHRPLPWEERKDRVGFSPSNRSRGVNWKGIEETMAATIGLGKDLICGVRFEECLRRKRQCKIGVDEVVSPLYHRSGLEFLSQGTPCVCSYDDFTEATLKDATGADRMPFIKANPSTLQRILWKYIKMTPDDERREMGRKAREWIEHYYHPRLLLRRYLDVYAA